MALINKKYIIFFSFIIASVNVFAHAVYQQNDIPLLDNRFRIDPNTEQVTIILNHPKENQKIVLVQPNGSKLYEQRHPEDSVAWLTTRDQDIITIKNPAPGPWQAIAKLDGDNRIQLLNPVSLKVGKLPIRVYRNEYLTTDVSLVENDEIMTDKHFLQNAKLSVSLIGEAKKLITLYKDDGQDYDALPFDGKLTAHMFLNLIPGRYALSISTRNNIFIRAYNKEVVVFPTPITYNTEQYTHNVPFVKFTFIVDESEIDPNSVTIDGTIKGYNQNNSNQSIIHLNEHKPRNNIFIIKVPLEYDLYTYSAKAYATTKEGREIILQLPERTIEVTAPYIPPVIDESVAIEKEKALKAAAEKRKKQYRYLWIFLSILVGLIVVIILIAIYMMKRKEKKLAKDNGLTLNELTIDELQPTPIDLPEETEKDENNKNNTPNDDKIGS